MNGRCHREWQETPEWGVAGDSMGSGSVLQEWGLAGDSMSGEWQETPGVGSGRRLQVWGVAGDSRSGE